jgi:hypothetical protein
VYITKTLNTVNGRQRLVLLQGCLAKTSLYFANVVTNFRHTGRQETNFPSIFSHHISLIHLPKFKQLHSKKKKTATGEHTTRKYLGLHRPFSGRWLTKE